MNSGHPSPAEIGNRRSGFSLMELMIVLGLLVAVAAIATPTLLSEMRNNRVYDAGETVREVLAESRRLAIDSGIDYQFRYEPNGQHFIVVPTEIEPKDSNSLIGEQSTSTYVRLTGDLGSGFRIRAMDDTQDTAERLGPEWFGNVQDGALLAQKSWSTARLFRFDGTSDDFKFRVTDDAERTVEISVRGLTGAVRLSQVYQGSL
ncbi:MAG: prepilin-type N-terminal cleavage/methylation domain-containing protein [Planctomycetaceae bacterium]